MSYTDKPSGMEGDTVPAVQYPADEEKKHQQRSSTSNVQSASAHLATPAPALPPRHSKNFTFVTEW